VVSSAQILNQLGIVAADRGNTDTAKDAHLDAKQLLEQTPDSSATRDLKRELARTLDLLNSH